jgi:hypothetical protein
MLFMEHVYFMARYANASHITTFPVFKSVFAHSGYSLRAVVNS